MRILITGGAGFIGSVLMRHILGSTDDHIVNIDKLTYAGNSESIEDLATSPRYAFEKLDICNLHALTAVFQKHQPDAVLHLAAESHVDRSIDGPSVFLQTNIMGSATLLEAARAYWDGLDSRKRAGFRFHHVSTDEVYGDLGDDDPAFDERSQYRPSSPYAASKAASDHLVRSWHRTYHFPILVTNCSNNYGPYQFPEKLIPLMILNALEGKLLGGYGEGQQIRDWLYVEDHARALHLVLTRGRVGETYNIGGLSEMRNIEVVRRICQLLEELAPQKPAGVSRYEDLITFVADRPGHDYRYAMDVTKVHADLGWSPLETFETGLTKTVQWYLDNASWCRRVQDGSYQRERLGSR